MPSSYTQYGIPVHNSTHNTVFSHIIQYIFIVCISRFCLAVTLFLNATHTILDLDYRPSFWESEAVAKKVTLEAISKSTVLVGNRREFEVVSGLTDPKKISEHYLGDQISTVIVKLGEQGVYLSAKGEEYLLPPLKVDVRCGLGAGDSFGGMLIHGLLNSWSLEKIGSYANVAGAIVASRLMCSDAMPTLSEVEAMVKEKV